MTVALPPEDFKRDACTCVSQYLATAHVAVLNEERGSETAAALFTPLSSPHTSIIKVPIDHFAR